jgi:dCTP deaminase
MILSDSAILKEIENKNIVIEPFNREHLNPCSVDLTINSKYKVYEREENIVCSFRDIPNYVKYNTEAYRLIEDGSNFLWTEPLDARKPNKTIELEMPEEGLVLIPGNLYICYCNEEIGIRGNIAAQVLGKSSLGRLGLDVIIGPSGFVDAGFPIASLVLELRATVPLRIYPNMKICQMRFDYIQGDILENYEQKKGSKYVNQKGAQESLNHLNFKQ